MADETPVETPKRRPGRPKKVGAAPVPTMRPPEPLTVVYSLKGDPQQHALRCSERSQDGPFLVFVSRETWQEKRTYIAISEIATLEVTGHPQLVGSPVVVSQGRSNAANGIPPAAAPQAVSDAEFPPPGSYSSQAVWKEQQVKAMMLRSDPMKMASTVLNENGGLEVAGVAWLDGAPPE